MLLCRSERHIGVDQGIRNFAIAAVDKVGNERPRVVGVELYDLAKLGLGQDVKQVKAASIATLLGSYTKLLSWMQKRGTSPLLPHVDRVIVHIEQMAKTNKFHMEFGINLGSELQRLVDPLECIIKLSQPNVHRSNGPMFKLGPRIIRECDLAPSVYGSARQMESQQALIDLLKTTSRPKPAPLQPSDVEPSDNDSGDEEHRNRGRLVYAVRNFMSVDFDFILQQLLAFICTPYVFSLDSLISLYRLRCSVV